MIYRHYPIPILLCLLLQGCAGHLKPISTYKPPRGAAPMENGSLDTGQLEPRVGHKGDQIGAEVVGTESLGDEQLIEIRLPVDPALVDRVYVYDSTGQSVNLSREAQIVHNYETNNVGISIRIPNSDNMGFRLKLIDNSNDDWPPNRLQ